MPFNGRHQLRLQFARCLRPEKDNVLLSPKESCVNSSGVPARRTYSMGTPAAAYHGGPSG